MHRFAPAVLIALSFTGFVNAQEAKLKKTLPSGVEVKFDIAYVPDGHERQNLDLYLPKSEKPLPLVVWIHGGGWKAGNKANPPLVYLTNKGFALASINYRLSQHAVYPAQIHDCKAAVRFLRAHAKEFNIDPKCIGVAGASAGGHLAALMGTTGDVKDVEGALGKHTGVSSRVQAVFDLFGPTDMSLFGDLAADSMPGLLFGGRLKDKSDLVKLANPIAFVTKDDPPVLIIHGDKDTLVPISQSEVFETSLKKADVPVTLVRIAGAGHGGLQFVTSDVLNQVEVFFRKNLAKTNP